MFSVPYPGSRLAACEIPAICFVVANPGRVLPGPGKTGLPYRISKRPPYIYPTHVKSQRKRTKLQRRTLLSSIH